MERKLNLDLSVKLWLKKSESGRVGIEGNRSVVSEKANKDGLVWFLDQVLNYPQCLRGGRK